VTRSISLAALVAAILVGGCGGGSKAPASPPRPPAREIAATQQTAAPAATPRAVGPPPIVKSYIPFGQKRKNETRAYSREHYGLDTYRLTDPHLVIWHYTETSNYQSVFNTFADDLPDVEFHELPQVCSHFVVDTDGTIHQLVPLGIICRHVVGLNYTAIGIEIVGRSDQQVLGNSRQFRAAALLTRWLRCRSAIPIRGVIGHNESLQSPYYRELVPAFRGQTHGDFNRADMNIVRARVATLPCRA
jgi:N-acetylmuramoyl-L-alanine amidase